MTSPKRGFAQSMEQDPQLETGETPEQFKDRILGVVKTIVENGLKFCDGELQFGLDEDKAREVSQSLSANDVTVLMHSNDDLLRFSGAFMNEWCNSQMGPEKNQSTQWALQGKDPVAEALKMKNGYLPSIEILLRNMGKAGLDAQVQPRRWDTCGRNGLGHNATGVSAQVSLAGKGLRL